MKGIKILITPQLIIIQIASSVFVVNIFRFRNLLALFGEFMANARPQIPSSISLLAPLLALQTFSVAKWAKKNIHNKLFGRKMTIKFIIIAYI